MEITWLGHCCFRLRAKEATVVTDPCDKSTGYSLGRPTADLVTVSLDDPAHNHVAGVAGSPRVIAGPGEFEVAATSVVGISTWHDAEKTRHNVVYVIELEDLRICHLGSMGVVPTSDQVEEIGSVDILMVPVGGGHAFDAPPAAETVSLLEPKLVIPMHFKTDVERERLDPIDRFLKEMSTKAPESHAKIAVTRSSLPDEMQMLVLDYKR
jgi:L-ascorbate metabolism protein UlaG (beta-lactamase superfamily)